MDPITLLGASAAGAQFVTYGITSLLQLITLLQRFKDTPEKVRTQLEDGKKSIERLSQLRVTLQSPDSDIAKSLTASQIQELQSTVDDSHASIVLLSDLLRPLIQRPDGTPHRGVAKSWKTVKGLLRIQEIDEKLLRIQRLHNEVLQQLQISDLDLSARMSLMMTKMSTSIAKTRNDVNSIDLRLMSIQHVTDSTHHDLRHTSDGIAALVTGQETMRAQVMAISPMIQEIQSEQHQETLHREHVRGELRSLGSQVAETSNDILNLLTVQSHRLSMVAADRIYHIPVADREDIARRVSCALLRSPSALRDAMDAAAAPCRGPFPNVRVRRESKKQTELAIRLWPLLQKTLNLSLVMNTGAGACSISISLRTIATVKRSTSPIFQLLDEMADDLLSGNGFGSISQQPKALREMDTDLKLTQLLEDLRHVSTSGKANLTDRDEWGTTVFQTIIELFAFLDLWTENLANHLALFWVLFQNTEPDLSEMVSLCYPGYLQPRLKLKHKVSFAQYIISAVDHSLRINHADSYFLPYLQHFLGEEMTGSIYYQDPKAPVWEGLEWIKLLNKKPQLIDLFDDPSGLATAIANRRAESILSCYNSWKAWAKETEQSLITITTIGWFGCSRVGLTPLEFAFGWPEGVQLLICAGASPEEALANSAKFCDIETLKVLLDERQTYAFTVEDIVKSLPSDVSNIKHFDNYGVIREWNGVIREWKRGGRREFWNIVRKAIKCRRDLLLQDVSSALSTSKLPDLGRNRHAISYSSLSDIHSKFTGHHPVYSRALAVHEPNLVYHFVVSIGHPIELLWILYDNGFDKIDEIHQGKTPLQKVDTQRPLIALWFLSKGATPRIPLFFRGVYDSTFVMSYYFSLLFVKERSDLQEALRLISPREASYTELYRWTRDCKLDARDQCSCFCSSKGCSAIHLFDKNVRPRDRRDDLDPCFGRVGLDRCLKLWCERTDCPPEVVKEMYEETCRLELFERLDMEHTCRQHVQDEEIYSDWTRPLTSAEIEEIQDEYKWSSEQLILLMKAYRASRDYDLPHSPVVDDYASHLGSWWEELNVILPDLEGYEPSEWCRHCRFSSREEHMIFTLRKAGYIDATEEDSIFFNGRTDSATIPDFLEVIRDHFAHYLDRPTDTGIHARNSDRRPTRRLRRRVRQPGLIGRKAVLFRTNWRLKSRSMWEDV